MKRRIVMVLALMPLVAFWGCGTDTTTTPDTTPPLAPQLSGATLQDGNVGVWWQANSEPDLAGYYVYYVENGVTHSASTSPITSNYLLIDAANPSGPVDVYVTAIDYSGNESSPSASMRASAQITNPNRQIIGGSPKDF